MQRTRRGWRLWAISKSSSVHLPLLRRVLFISFLVKTSVLTNLIVGFWNRILDHRSGALNIVGSFLRDSQRRWARHGLGGTFLLSLLL